MNKDVIRSFFKELSVLLKEESLAVRPDKISKKQGRDIVSYADFFIEKKL